MFKLKESSTKPKWIEKEGFEIIQGNKILRTYYDNSKQRKQNKFKYKN